MVKNLIFDFGRVLLDYDTEVFMDKYFNLDEKGRDFFRNVIFSQKWIDHYDKEDMPFDETVAYFKKTYPEYASDIEIFDVHYQDVVTGEVPGMRDVLIQLKQRGFRLYGLSNWNCKIVKVLEQYDILNMMDDMLISSRVHLIKPGREIYLKFLETFRLDPAECVFTDDKTVNIEGARSVGIDGIVFRNAAQYMEELEPKLL